MTSTKKPRKPRAARKPKQPMATITVIRPNIRDVTRIPAEIARRVNLVFALKGRENVLRWHYDARWQAMMIAFAEGKAEASWRQWNEWQETEARLYFFATKCRRESRPMVQDGNDKWIPAPLTRAERLAMPPETPKNATPRKPRFDGNNIVELRPRQFTGRQSRGPRNAA